MKIDPKSIGVGQYQHDVSQTQLARKLDAVVEDCVNAVGVDLNTASVPLLTRVAGLTRMMAQNIVTWRDENGRFQNRQQLLKVSRLGPKAFEQCAGFLRINHGDNPLDASTVHPEAYPVVERILAATQQALQDLMGNSSELRDLKASQFTDERFGVPTVTDIIKELEKPGRDPRPEFKTAQFAEGVETMNDLTPGMVLEGASDQRHQLRRICRYRRASGRPGSHLVAVRQVHRRSAQSGESGRYREGQSAGS
ncbi:comEA protein [Cedecea neteri]|uniref:ComEA protein n=1 Tax=Cedecea neteri TaxID=158822 RepID=A0A2X2T1F4_9ENTR|nr:comEA protein [Cedecea neteri]